MAGTHQLVEHCFRRAHGQVVAALVAKLGVRHFDLAEDAAQGALARALQAWSRRGPPENPEAWLYRTARNLALDALRRERLHQRALPALAAAESELPEDPLDDGELADAALRLLFAVCDEALPLESRIALALKALCGLSVAEIARALLTTEANAQKRIARAKEKLRAEGRALEPPPSAQLPARLEAVLATVYLLFNEGYLAMAGDEPLRRELCDEALRLARLLAAHPAGADPAARALLALLCFHAARAPARIAADGGLELLADQDRSRWDWTLVREGLDALTAAATGARLTRYHLEAAIAWEHLRAPNLEATDWRRIAALYAALARVAPSPMLALNQAIAEARHLGPAAGLRRLDAVPADEVPRQVPTWPAARAQFLAELGDPRGAIAALEQALNCRPNNAERALLLARLAAQREAFGAEP